MSGIELFPFQAQASTQIAKRFIELMQDDGRPTVTKRWEVPFYQALSALTGAGKTPILADAVAQMRAHLAIEPIVLWISKAKVVVDQTYANFEPGGKYSHLLEGFLIEYLSELSADRIADGTSPQIVLSTVGTFNQNDRSDGTLRVHKVQEDRSDEALWTMLTNRATAKKQRRPLIVVYDEGHNLSDQQTELLLELEPDALLLASATLQIPGKLARLIERLSDHKGQDFLITQVPSKKVVEAGLVKRQIMLGGYSTLMETALDDMLDAMKLASSKAKRFRAGFEPKAIYVCKTNISQEDGSPDNPSRPFNERQAPPILIWRYLVETQNVDPATIAVYCDLKFDRSDHPPPKSFVHFSGGDQDFAIFTAGNFKHIIFNLSLQEGWDDPACYFAYIDKSMGSKVQIEQVIGRVLRQPNARHYPDADLNTASFYIRVDDTKQEFPKILDTVRRRIAADMPDVAIDGFTGAKGQQKHKRDPSDEKIVPEVHIDADKAGSVLVEAIKRIPDFRQEGTLTVGQGQVAKALQTVGDGSVAEIVETERQHANRVVVRWLLRRAIQEHYPPVAAAIDLSGPKYDARVELTSSAADILREQAEKLVTLYLDHSELTYEVDNPYTVGPIFVNPTKLRRFKNALHEGYSDLRPFELEVAQALDDLGHPWARNPTNGGFSIPLLQKGDTRRFYPDFLVWVKNYVVALDPKGDHLISSDASRKLLDIQDERGRRKLLVRLLTAGQWTADPVRKTGSDGYSVWSLKSGKQKATYCPSLEKALRLALTV